MLTVCSTDGYVTFLRFADGALGDTLEDKDVPLIVRQNYSCVYNYTPPAPPEPEPELVVAAPVDGEERIGVVVSDDARVDTPKLDSEAACDGVIVSDDTTTSSDADEKKRKRITPILVAPLIGADKENTLPTVSQVTVSNVTSGSSSASVGCDGQPKAKKRITPMTVATYPQQSSS